MQRTTTTATLLVTVAVSALSGCVTVQRPPLPRPSVAPSQPSAPRPDGRAEPQVVQAPAREALELVGPSRRPEKRAPAAHAAPPAAQEPPPPPAHPRPRPHPPHREPARPPRRSRVEVPDLPEPAGKSVRRNTDVCALGREYGGWRPDSPEAVICKRAYGR